MIERTLDYRIVNRFISWPCVISSKFFYLMERNNKEDVGLWALHEHEDGLRIHADMGAKCRGQKAIESAKQCFSWIFRNTTFRKIYAGIPEENKPACQVAVRAGMKLRETQFTGLDKNGKLCNKIRWFQLSQGW